MSCRQLRQEIETASSAVVADESDDRRPLEDQLVVVALVIAEGQGWKLHLAPGYELAGQPARGHQDDQGGW